MWGTLFLTMLMCIDLVSAMPRIPCNTGLMAPLECYDIRHRTCCYGFIEDPNCPGVCRKFCPPDEVIHTSEDYTSFTFIQPGWGFENPTFSYSSIYRGVTFLVKLPEVTVNGLKLGTTIITVTAGDKSRCSFSLQVKRKEDEVIVDLTEEQQKILQQRVQDLKRDMKGDDIETYLKSSNGYKRKLIDLTTDQVKDISESCYEASAIQAVHERMKRANRVCPGYTSDPTNLVAFDGNNMGQLIWLNNVTPWAFNEECVNSRPSSISCISGYCECQKTSRTTKALLMIIDLDSQQLQFQVSTVWKDVTVWSCSTMYW